MATDTISITMTPCPDCGDYSWYQHCYRCSGTRWIPDPNSVQATGYNPNIKVSVNSEIDPALWVFLTRLEEKLDRLLVALDGDA